MPKTKTKKTLKKTLKKMALDTHMQTVMETPTRLAPGQEVPMDDPLPGIWCEKIQQQEAQLAELQLESERLTRQRKQLEGSNAFTQAALKGVERELEASLGVYDCVQERVDALLMTVDTLELRAENLAHRREAVENEFGELLQEVIGLRGERAELKDTNADLRDEWGYLKRVVAIETAFLLAQPQAQHAGESPSRVAAQANGLGSIASFWWSLVWLS